MVQYQRIYACSLLKTYIIAYNDTNKFPLNTKANFFHLGCGCLLEKKEKQKKNASARFKSFGTAHERHRQSVLLVTPTAMCSLLMRTPGLVKLGNGRQQTCSCCSSGVATLRQMQIQRQRAGYVLQRSVIKSYYLHENDLPGEIYEMKRPYDRFSRHFVTGEQQNSCQSRFQALAGIGGCGRICLGLAGHMTYNDGSQLYSVL